MGYFFDLFLRFALLANLSLALLIPFRWGGRLALCQGVFVGFGAYALAYAVAAWHVNALIAVGVAAVAGGGGGWLLARSTARLNSATFALVTFLLAVAGMEVFENWDAVTGGRRGIGGLPPVDVVRLGLSAKAVVGLLLAAVCAAAALLVRKLYGSQFGRATRALRDDAVGAELDGVSAARLERDVLIFFGFYSALVGALWAFSLPRVIPEYFDFWGLPLPVVLACILGGGEKPLHSVVGAASVLAIDEATQLLPLRPEVRADVPVLIVGAAYVIVMVWRGQLNRLRAAFGDRFGLPGPSLPQKSEGRRTAAATETSSSATAVADADPEDSR